MVSDTATPWTAADQASLSSTVSWSLLKFMSIESVMRANHLILCCPLLLLPSMFPVSGSFPMSWFFASGGQGIGLLQGLKVFPGGSLVVQSVKNPPAMLETRVQSLGWEDPVEEGMATHSSILVWRIPWTEEPGWLQSIESQSDTVKRVNTHSYFFEHISLHTSTKPASLIFSHFSPALLWYNWQIKIIYT